MASKINSPEEQELPFIDRFIIERRLGAGGFGVVYQAYDRERNTRVALKTLNEFDGEGLYSFKQEFRVLADIAHPHLVSLYELMSAGEKLFFTMELVEGVTFLEYVRDRNELTPALHNVANAGQNIGKATQTILPANTESGLVDGSNTIKADQKTQFNNLPFASVSKLNQEKLRATLKQLAEGVHALHQAGKLHRDIKPPNVLVTKEGRVVILDFGLATELTREQQRKSIAVTGTPEYMSPEHAAGQPITEASDWYSVGVMLYQALTNELPFDSTFGNVLLEKQRYDPPSPKSQVADIPDDLNDLCNDLLKRDPKLRPSGHEILDRLGVTLPHATVNHSAHSATRALPLIGREHHLAVLNESFQAMKKGNTLVVYAHGRSGMGKSVLMRHFLDEVQQQEPDCVILSGRCYEQESVPYKALDSVIDALSQYLKSLPRNKLATILPSDVLILARIFPVLHQVDAVAEAKRNVLEIPDSQELRSRAFAALRELLVQLAAKYPLIIFIDDLQWGDLDSAALLSELLRPPNPPQLLLIASYRSDEVDTNPILRTLLSARASSNTAVQLREVSIAELSQTDSRRLVQELLGKEETLSPKTIDSIVRESAGSPFFIDELVRYAQMNAKAFQDDSAQTDSTGMKLDKVLQYRISKLPEKAYTLLTIVAVAGQPIERVVAKRAAQLEMEEQTALGLLRSGHLIRVKGSMEYEEIETYHDRIRETIVANLTPQQLQNYHGNLVTALEASGVVDPERLVVHCQSAIDHKRAAKYAKAAAEQASDALAFDRAARLYQLAIQFQIDQAQSDPIQSDQFRMGMQNSLRELQIKLGDAQAKAGRCAESAQAYLTAAEGAELSLMPALMIELQQRAAEQFLRGGYIDEGLAVLTKVLAQMGMKLAKTPMYALLLLLFRRLLTQLRGIKFQERDSSQIPAEQLIRIDTCWSAATGLAIVDTIRGSDFQTRHLLLALQVGEPYRIARALSWEIAYSAVSGGRSKKRTEKFIQASIEMAERLDHPHVHGLAALMPGMATFLEGRWKDACEYLDRAETILRTRCTGVAWELNTVHLFSLRTLYYLGDLHRLSDKLPIVLKEARERGDLYAEISLRTRVSYTNFLIRDEVQEAKIELDQSIKRWSQRGFHIQHFFTFIGDVEIALYNSNGALAWQTINKKWKALSHSYLLRLQFLFIEALHLRARAALAAATTAQDRQTLINTARRDAKRMEREDMGYGNAFAQLVYATIKALNGDKEGAARQLVTATVKFQMANMPLYAAAARRCRGQLLGGETGNALINDADNWMRQQGIISPQRMAAMLVPGKW